MINLEEKFKDLDLTEREFKQLKSRVMRRYPDWKSYDIRDVQGLFQYNNINQKVISQEIIKIKNKRKERGSKRGFSRIRDWNFQQGIIGAIFLGAIACSMAVLCAKQISKNNRLNEFNELYGKTKAIYADTNKDGIISPGEIKNLNYKVLSGKNVIYNGEEDIYSACYPDGSKVSVEDLTKWIKAYQPKN